MTAALFLDRDGVINIDHGYVYRPDQVEWVPDVFGLAKTAIECGLKVIIVTNQAGIGRGYYSESDFHALMEWMGTQFRAHGAALTDVYFCPFHPDGIGDYKKQSDRRKPAPGMLLDAARDHKLDLAASWIIGDQLSDIEAGRAGGLRRLGLFRNQDESRSMDVTPLSSHLDSIAWLTGRETKSGY
jgi:D-glycero-D-manno-heptose 1,7-bisphosphate phosphatase